MVSAPDTTRAARHENLYARARIIQQIRAFFIAHAYLEVETPHRIPCNAPEEHIEPIPSAGAFLQTSPELCMKRLLAAGYPRLFQLCRCWRNAERGTRHLPEFTLLEWYAAHSDYRDLMHTCEALLCHLLPTGMLIWQGSNISIQPPFERIPLDQAFSRFAPMSLEEALVADCFEEIYTEHVEPELGTAAPVFIYDYPASMAALARTRADAPHLAERFELYIGGMELANAFTELTDAHEQRERFDAALETMQPPNPQHLMPEAFLAELEHMPPSAGIALGVDRLVMLLTNAAEIDTVVAFTPEELQAGVRIL
ncbi:MAG: EF-P lysine aminoacylase EpmA [Desulfuromonadaceae bacterium]